MRTTGTTRMPTPEQHDGTEGSAVDLSPEFLEAVRRWENAPHNRPGTDKTWVERLTPSELVTNLLPLTLFGV